MRGQAQALHLGHRADNPLIRVFSFLTMMACVAIVVGAPPWAIYLIAALAVLSIIVDNMGEPKK